MKYNETMGLGGTSRTNQGGADRQTAVQTQEAGSLKVEVLETETGKNRHTKRERK